MNDAFTVFDDLEKTDRFSDLMDFWICRVKEDVRKVHWVQDVHRLTSPNLLRIQNHNVSRNGHPEAPPRPLSVLATSPSIKRDISGLFSFATPVAILAGSV